MSGSAELADKLVSAWRRQRGEEIDVSALQALSTGASSDTYAFDATSRGLREHCILQLFGGGESFVSALSKPEQARTQQVAFHACVGTPEVLQTVGGDEGLAEGFALGFFEGDRKR